MCCGVVRGGGAGGWGARGGGGRVAGMARRGVDRVGFELWSLVVSAINGCGMCLEAHEKVCREHGLSSEQIQAAVRIAATVHAVARTLSAEEAVLAAAA